MAYKAIRKQAELDEMIKFGVIADDVLLRGEDELNINGVSTIMGEFSIYYSNVVSLSDLMEVKGNCYIKQTLELPILTSLGNLEKVGGYLNLNGSQIRDLGKLSHVGGALNLKGLKINNLGNLTFVGGNLALPKRLKDKVDLSKITINGDIRYYKDSIDKPQITSIPKNMFVINDIVVPEWGAYRLYQIQDWEIINNEISTFYESFKKKFLLGQYIDVKGNYTYVSAIMHELVKEYEQHNNLELLKRQSEIIEKIYPRCGKESIETYNSFVWNKLTIKYKVDKNIDSFIADGNLMLIQIPDIQYFVSSRLVEFIIEDYLENKDLQKFNEDLEYVIKLYPALKGKNHYDKIILSLENSRKYNQSWKYVKKHYSWDLYKILFYENKLKINIFDSDFIIHAYKGFSSLGRKLREKIEPYVYNELKEFELLHKKKFLDVFFKNITKVKLPKSLSTNSYKLSFAEIKFYPVNYYKQFLTNENEFYNILDKVKSQNLRTNWLRNLSMVSIIIQQFCTEIKVRSENKFREDNGIRKIGEEWVNETALFYLILEQYSKYIVKRHAKPKWIGNQHLDIYLPELNIGVEYQGYQHYHPVDFFGGEEALKESKIRDKRKQEKCRKNGCKLIIVDEGYDFEDVKKMIDEYIKKLPNLT